METQDTSEEGAEQATVVDSNPAAQAEAPAPKKKKAKGIPKYVRQRKTPAARKHYTAEQLETFYAEIEDWMFCEGMHREVAAGRLMKQYKVPYATALTWILKTQIRWREAQSQEELTDRHYQLERMAHSLYQTALDGIAPELKRQLLAIEKLIKDGLLDEAREKLNALAKGKLRNLSVAQRVLWNLSAMAGIGHKVTLDLSGAGVTLPDLTKALPAKTNE